ncbi:uncharacterized protein N7506_001519 [Penicillium brevicompactum]|uniref:uncharacterized protein n=1 Tax=Penicillium brevicompactum TaxID=5074 RepID=UPI0025406F8C|nr:uncharacterized protein N7506_001519 [Penicillium brevicompactum]KAJ5348266.1 hypothetical protein N7506_001519 [Penicillium brevicompactum]
MAEMEKTTEDHVEAVDGDLSKQKDPAAEVEVMGTVKLTEDTIVYIPTPTADPRGMPMYPLNMSIWQKIIILIVVSTYSALGNSLVSGFGGLITFYLPEYSAAGKDYAAISALLTYPTLFMGIGNLIGMPLAIAVGRRVVLLVCTLILVLGTVLCITAESYEWHLGARMLIGFSAGQSEALVPMITQEVFFLHERAKYLMVQQTVQVILTTIWTLFASPIAGAITPQGWYGLGAGLAGLQFIVAFFLLPETKYDRDLSAYQEFTGEHRAEDDVEATKSGKPVALCKQRPDLDFVRYQPRTWKSDMRLWIGKPEWHKAAEVIKQTCQLFFFPNVFWALCLNGLTLGVNVAMGTTYGSILTAAPYNWPDTSASYVNCGQIIVALIALPLLGTGSDRLIRKYAERNGGVHEPETRIVPLILPIIVGTITIVFYGQGAAHPEKYHWFVYVWAMSAYYFAFVGANIVAITYLLDSYPARAGPMLVIICAFRGFISFGTSYGTTPFVQSQGYDGAFGIFGALTAAFGLLGVPVFIWGKNIRHFTGRFAKGKTD